MTSGEKNLHWKLTHSLPLCPEKENPQAAQEKAGKKRKRARKDLTCAIITLSKDGTPPTGKKTRRLRNTNVDKLESRGLRENVPKILSR